MECEARAIASGKIRSCKTSRTWSAKRIVALRLVQRICGIRGDAIVDVPTEEWPNLKMQNVFPKMSKTQGEIRWAGVTTLGAHNQEIYGDEFGIPDDELARLKENSII